MASRLLKEFKEFAMKGSVVDLAVGIIIGTAFGAIVKSLVDDLIMPLVGVLLGGADFSNRYFVVKGGGGLAGNETVEAARATGAAVVAYGKFANNVLTFLIVAASVFLLVKAINKMRRKSEKEPMPTTRPCPECTSSIARAARRCPSCTAAIQPLA
ncbi:MAG: large conductance mechanosensitive channel protein MscL [Candidatus Thermoplasmatota archaeon]|jgi:large conductance mechanosensitive channel